MLTREQNREFNRCKKLQEFLTAQQTVYASFIPFAEETQLFNGNFAALQALLPDKNVVTTGLTADKRSVKQKLAKALALVCAKTKAYAIRYNKAELSAQMESNDSVIFKMKDAALPAFAQTIKTLVVPLLGVPEYVPYGITQATLDSLATDAQAFGNLIGAAGVKASGNTVTNAAINTVIDKLRANIKQFDLLIDEFESSHPQFVQGYHINSAVDNTGTRHSGIEGMVRNAAGEAISNATVKLEDYDKSTISEIDGTYRLDFVQTGDYKVICSAAGYAHKTLMHHIARGRIDELNFVLQEE